MSHKLVSLYIGEGEYYTRTDADNALAEKDEEIARGFIAEGWKEVPDNEKENAMYELNGWIDERNMDAFEPRKGTRFFLIDVKTLTWKCFFKKGVA